MMTISQGTCPILMVVIVYISDHTSANEMVNKYIDSTSIPTGILFPSHMLVQKLLLAVAVDVTFHHSLPLCSE